MSENKKIETKAPEPHKPTPGEGIRSMKSTTAFRAINFELYAKPSKLATIDRYAITLQLPNK